jgi:hypothetical protein
VTIVINVEKKVFHKLDRLKEDIRVVIEENDQMQTELKEKNVEIVRLKLELAAKTENLVESKRLLNIFMKSAEKDLDLDYGENNQQLHPKKFLKASSSKHLESKKNKIIRI